MDISSQAEFGTDPATVYAMMTSKEYLERVCEASHALEHEVVVTGSNTRTSRTLPAPAMAARFTGPTLNVVEDIAWGEPAADGGRVGALSMTVPGQPLSMMGTMTITPGGARTVVTLASELKVSVPLLGKKMEEGAAPVITSGFRTHQQVGDEWIATH